MLEAVLTGSEDDVSRDELAVRYFTCSHCGASGEVAFGAEGEGGWFRDRLIDDGIRSRVERRAEVELRTDADRTQALIRCPTCGRRASGAARWAAIRVGFWAACGVAMLAIGEAHLLFGAAGCGLMTLWQGLREGSRFKRAARASILMLEPGARHEPEPPRPRPVVRRQLAPPPDLPPARVITAPAPVVQAPPDPSAPPKFLGEPDES